MFELASPWVLILLPLPLLFRWLWPVAKTNKQSALKVPFFTRVKHLETATGKPSFDFLSKSLWLPSLIWLLLVFALSGPQWLGSAITFPQSGRDIMLALDLSGSMQTPDMELNGHYFDRLAVVKIAARKFIEARKGDKLGLVLFGTRAYLQTPLTFDTKTVLQMLDDATIGLAGTQTAIGDAVGLAIKQLEKAPGKSKVIILLTDGGNNAGVVSPLDAAQVAKELGIKIFTIGIGSNKMMMPGLFGTQMVQASNELDERTLKEMAKITNGLFFRADSGSDLQNVYAEINKLVPVVSAKKTFRPIKPLYPWPLGLALLLSFYLILSSSFKFTGKFTKELS